MVCASLCGWAPFNQHTEHLSRTKGQERENWFLLGSRIPISFCPCIKICPTGLLGSQVFADSRATRFPGSPVCTQEKRLLSLETTGAVPHNESHKIHKEPTTLTCSSYVPIYTHIWLCSSNTLDTDTLSDNMLCNCFPRVPFAFPFSKWRLIKIKRS